MVFVKKLGRNTIKAVTNSHQGLTFYCNTLLAWAREAFSILNENNFGKMKNIYDWILAIEQQCSQEIKLLLIVSSCVLYMCYYWSSQQPCRLAYQRRTLTLVRGHLEHFPFSIPKCRHGFLAFLGHISFKNQILLVDILMFHLKNISPH